MKLNIQLYGGRGASSSNNIKTYTKKDIEPIKKYYSKNPIGYKLGDTYLLKNYYGLRTTEQYNWIISKSEYTPSYSGEYNKQIDNNEIMQVRNYKEGKEKLVEIANNIKLRNTRKVK